jgi:hypothetical protein
MNNYVNFHKFKMYSKNFLNITIDDINLKKFHQSEWFRFAHVYKFQD